MNMTIQFGKQDNFIKRNKGKSLIDFPNDYTIIDLETTGLDPQFDEIIEMSALKIKNNKIIDQFSTLIRPEYEIDKFIEDLTGITNIMLKNAPLIEDKISEFVKFIGNDIIIGHNVNFDINFLYDNYLKITDKELKNDFVDTMRLSRNYLKELNHHRLIDLVNYYNIDVEQFHRALSDCKSTFDIYNSIKGDIINEFENIQNFKDTLKRKKDKVQAKNIISSNKEFDIDNLLYNKNCVFTGKLEKMERKEAMQRVVNIGGLVQDNINKNTNFLIIGSLEYSTNIKGNKSNKIRKAEQLKAKGNDIEILSENIFYELINVEAQYKDDSITENTILENIINKLSDKFDENDFDIVSNTDDYLTLRYRNSDIVRVKYTKKSKWISILMVGIIRKENENNILFELQKNKKQIFWKSKMEDPDIDKYLIFIDNACKSMD